MMLEQADHAEGPKERQQVLAIDAAEHAVDRLVARFLVSLRNIDFARDAPIAARWCAPGFLGTRNYRLPVSFQVAIAERHAHRHEAALAGKFQRIRARRQTGNS